MNKNMEKKEQKIGNDAKTEPPKTETRKLKSILKIRTNRKHAKVKIGAEAVRKPKTKDEAKLQQQSMKCKNNDEVEVDPYLSTKKSTIWESILMETEKENLKFADLYEKEEPDNLAIMSASTYLKLYVYPLLTPALERCCALAMKNHAIQKPKQIFNGVDCISEYLWNNNPKYPNRKKNWLPAHVIYGQKNYFKLRPTYPLHWMMSRKEAALIIQKYWRGYNIRKIPDVTEMRHFWKRISKQYWIQSISDEEIEPKGAPRISSKKGAF